MVWLHKLWLKFVEPNWKLIRPNWRSYINVAIFKLTWLVKKIWYKLYFILKTIQNSKWRSLGKAKCKRKFIKVEGKLNRTLWFWSSLSTNLALSILLVFSRLPNSSILEKRQTYKRSIPPWALPNKSLWKVK